MRVIPNDSYDSVTTFPVLCDTLLQEMPIRISCNHAHAVEAKALAISLAEKQQKQQQSQRSSAGEFATLSVANCYSALHLNTMRDS